MDSFFKGLGKKAGETYNKSRWLYDSLLGTEIQLRQGDTVYMSQFIVHRHPHYSPDPSRFDPERFSEDRTDVAAQLAYFPFGA